METNPAHLFNLIGRLTVEKDLVAEKLAQAEQERTRMLATLLAVSKGGIEPAQIRVDLKNSSWSVEPPGEERSKP